MSRMIFCVVLVLTLGLSESDSDYTTYDVNSFINIGTPPQGLSGKILYYYAERYWQSYDVYIYEITTYRIDLPSLEVTRIKNFSDIFDEPWIFGSPNGDLFAYKNDDPKVGVSIKIFDYDGNLIYKVPLSIKRSRINCFSPDGAYLYFSNEFSGIARTNVSAHTSEYAIKSKKFTFDCGATLSPDGARLYWAHIERERLVDICAADVSSLPIKFDESLCEKIFSIRTFRIVEDPCIKFLDENTLIFKFTFCDEEKNREVYSKIWRYDLKTRESEKLFSTTGNISGLDCINGKYLSFRYYEHRSLDTVEVDNFYVFDIQTKTLFGSEYYYTLKFPWSPNGQFYLAQDDDAIYAVSLDEKQKYRIEYKYTDYQAHYAWMK